LAIYKLEVKREKEIVRERERERERERRGFVGFSFVFG